MPISCSFCIHVNPEGSKYCNECGSPLRLKPCPDCDAVNDHDAAQCHQCGATLDGRSECAHELAESVRTRETEASAHESGEPSSERAFFDQYLTALRRDMAGRPRASESHVTYETSGRAVDDRALGMAAAPVADAPPSADPRPVPQAEHGAGATAQLTLAAQSTPATQPSAPPAPADARSAQARPAAAPPSAEPRQTAAPSSAEAPRPMPAPTPRAKRSLLSPMLYVVGASLLVVGVLGYAHYLRDPLPGLQQWLAGFRSQVAASREFTTASRSITQLRGGTLTASDKAIAAEPAAAPMASGRATIGESTSAPSRGETPSTDSPAPAAPTTPATSVPTAVPTMAVQPTSVAKAPAQATLGPAQASSTRADPPTVSRTQLAATPSAESTRRGQSSQPLGTSAPAQANASDGAPQAAETPKHASRNEPKRGRQRRPTGGAAAIASPAPAAPAPAESIDTGTTTASPLAPICTEGISALGLCDPHSREAN